MTKIKAAIGTYVRAYGVLFLAVTIKALFSSGLETKAPTLWTHADIVIFQNGLWVALMAVAWRWYNKNDPVYGRASKGPASTVAARSVLPVSGK